jgi:TonB family protein
MPQIIPIKTILLVIAIIGGLTFANASGGPFYNGTKVTINVDSCDGPRSKQEIEGEFKYRSPTLMRIYGKYLKIKHGFNGKVTLKFTISPSDSVTDISLISSTTNYPEFDNAIKDAVVKFRHGWRDSSRRREIISDNATSTVQLEFVEYVDPKREKEREEMSKMLRNIFPAKSE